TAHLATERARKLFRVDNILAHDDPLKNARAAACNSGPPVFSFALKAHVAAVGRRHTSKGYILVAGRRNVLVRNGACLCARGADAHRLGEVIASRVLLERCALGAGNVHSADGWDDVLKPVVARYQGKVSRIYFRADAAFAIIDDPALAHFGLKFC